MPAAASARPRAHLNSRMPTTTDQTVGKRIRALRRAAGMTLQELGEAVGVSGVQFQRYETGTSRVAASRLLAICNALGVQVGALIDEAFPARPAQGVNARRGECMELARAFNAIVDPTRRQAVIALARAFAGWQEHPAAGALPESAGSENSTAPPGQPADEASEDKRES